MSVGVPHDELNDDDLELDTNHWLYDHIGIAVFPGDGAGLVHYDRKVGKVHRREGDTYSSRVTTRYGKGVSFDPGSSGNEEGIDLGDPPELKPTKAITILVGAVVDAAGAQSNWGRFIGKTSGSTNDNWGAIVRSSNRLLYFRINTSQVGGDFAAVADEYHHYVFRYSSDRGVTQILVDGDVKTSSGAISGDINTDGNVKIGRHGSATNRSVKADMYFCIVVNDIYLDDHQIREICNNPKQILRPKTVHNFGDVAAGPTIINRTLSDSIDVTDPQDQWRLRNRELQESIDTSDLLDVYNLRGRTLLDSFDLQDQLARKAVKVRALLETIDINDDLVPYRTLARVLADNADLADAIVAEIVSTGIITRVLSDSINLQDLRLKSLAKSRTLLDSLDVVDAVISELVSVGIITRTLLDSINLQDFRAKVLVKSRLDSLDVVDSAVSELVTVGIISRALLDSIDVQDIRYKIETKARKGQVDLQDDKALFIEKVRIIFDALDAIDNLSNKQLLRGRVLSDSIDLTDSIVTMFLLRRIVSEYVEISDSIDASVVFSGAGPIITFVLQSIKDELNIQQAIMDDLDIDTGIQ